MRRFIIILILVVSIFTTGLLVSDKGFNTAKIQGYKALKVFVQFKDNQIVTSDFLEYETEHFIIKYREEDENIIRDTSIMFEKSYLAAEKEFGYEPKNKTTVIIYKDQEELWSYQKSVQGQAVMGVYNMGTIHILSPNAYQNQGQNRLKYFESNGPVLHEYTHRIIDDLTGGNVELWFTEGMALYEEDNIYGTKWADGFLYERYFDSEEMREGFMYVDEVQSYRQSFDMVKYLIDNYGLDSVKLLLHELNNGESLDAAFLKVYGVTADEFIDSKVYATN
ncbi:MAG: peptidase MA family metallohydrolase [Lutisporaceae bacterium]